MSIAPNDEDTGSKEGLDEDDLFADLESRIAQADAPTRRAATWSTAARRGVAALLTTGLVGLTLGAFARGDFHVYPALRMTLALAAFGGLGVLALRSATRPLHRTEAPAWWPWALVAGTLVVTFAFAALPAAHAATAEATPHTALVSHALPCLLFGLAMGAPLVLLARLVDRGVSRGLLFATCAGAAVGNLTLQLHCPITEPLHLVAGHFTVALVLVGLGLAFDRAGPALRR